MKKEYISIVDENNNLIGEKKERKEVHSFGLWHRVVHIYYFMKKNNKYYFLCHLRSKEKDLSPNKWDTRFGGHVQSGESIEKAVVEELKEEIGLNSKFNEYIEGEIFKKENYPNNEFAYVFYYKGSEDVSNLKFQDNEVQKVKWFLAEDIIKNIKNDKKKWAGGVDDFKTIYKYLLENFYNN
ncbi:NUDIX domain-containing protein [bacterium]|nr:NUDIX domain-containing protein [bacterium]